MQSDDDSCDRLDTEDGQDSAAAQFARCSMKLKEFPEISSDENSLSSGVTVNC
ncbi:hypothetical protein D917_08332 [Trichinella nativa]|uniref:Uncharacterized protein n=1 Tax=Trichinella nativa TaxID=6335 RepID=A0A1Y3EKX1_9BILA|nr:hypothetical protein D917_08332 [Trichinella nativa]